ncbi:glycerol-3-phosphate 1-O-acyltransferase [Geovibrio thiophilus]|uniref:Glycerol-3-phosphate acyltransferase n=1 Tax=Geovibrio thiophilus TaxID=139438 RepID=A0A410JY28_9BACT|nr:glycerol-3-phosphate 1-O-acyltransferase PlsY [Geovibrio thiophilus]QAR33062.1 glycerol-3-phosphate 1-O-acyltransferase [Geovibrio thiophilus]
MKFVLLIICYLIGSIPTGYLLVKKVKGIDIRTVGSGNVGATNAARILGKWGFAAVFAVDMLKGFIPVWITGMLYPDVVLIAAVLVVLGHTYTVFLNFKGGKGVATAVGVFLALAPIPLGVAAVAFGVVIYISRMVSLSSITAAAVLAASVVLMDTEVSLKIFTVVIAAFVIYKHRTNISRIMKGEESRIEFKRKSS